MVKQIKNSSSRLSNMMGAEFRYISFVSSFLGIVLFLAAVQLSNSAFAGGVEKDSSQLLVNVNIPENYLHVYSGGSVLVETEIIFLPEENIANIYDIVIEYAIKEPNGAVVAKVMETKGSRKRLSTIEELMLPSNAKPGIYTLEVKVSKGDVENVAAETFEVIEKIPESKKEIKIFDNLMLTAVVFNFILILVIFLWMRKRRDG